MNSQRDSNNDFISNNVIRQYSNWKKQLEVLNIFEGAKNNHRRIFEGGYFIHLLLYLITCRIY